ncbi:MAG: hypothetical protein ACFHXK_09900 [bacterium]
MSIHLWLKRLITSSVIFVSAQSHASLCAPPPNIGALYESSNYVFLADRSNPEERPLTAQEIVDEFRSNIGPSTHPKFSIAKLHVYAVLKGNPPKTLEANVKRRSSECSDSGGLKYLIFLEQIPETIQIPSNTVYTASIRTLAGLCMYFHDHRKDNVERTAECIKEYL